MFCQLFFFFYCSSPTYFLECLQQSIGDKLCWKFCFEFIYTIFRVVFLQHFIFQSFFKFLWVLL